MATETPVPMFSASLTSINLDLLTETPHLNGMLALAGAPHLIKNIDADGDHHVTVTIDADSYGAQSEQDQKLIRKSIETEILGIWNKTYSIPKDGIDIEFVDLSDSEIYTERQMTLAPQ